MSTMAYYSVMKKNEPIPIAATCMKVAVIIPSDVSQKKKRHITYWWNLNTDIHEPTDKRKIKSPNQNTKLWLPEGKGEGRYQLGDWD